MQSESLLIGHCPVVPPYFHPGPSTTHININHTNMGDHIYRTICGLLKGADACTKKKLLVKLREDINKDELSQTPTPDPDLVSYHPNYISDDVLLAELKLDFEDMKKEHFNNNIRTRNSTNKVGSVWIGSQPYSYTGSSHPANEMTNYPGTSKLMQTLNSDPRFKAYKNFNSCQGTYYKNGKVALSLHSDDEKQHLDLSCPIVIMSFGVTRNLTLYPKVALHKSKWEREKMDCVKTVEMEDLSMTVMWPGCQEALAHMVPRSDDTTGERISLSFRVALTEEDTPASGCDASSDDLFGTPTPSSPPTSASPPKKPTTLILGTSITKGLIGEKLTKRNNYCHNISGSGFKISNLDKELDDFYKNPDFLNCDIKKVIVSVGTNDIRYCKGDINHLKTPMKNLINKLRDYYSDNIQIFIQSVLPVKVTNEYTILNVKRFNSMLFNICRESKCFYLDVFRQFLTFDGHFNQSLFVDGCHLKSSCMGLLARSYIKVINRDVFNPLIT